MEVAMASEGYKSEDAVNLNEPWSPEMHRS